MSRLGRFTVAAALGVVAAPTPAQAQLVGGFLPGVGGVGGVGLPGIGGVGGVSPVRPVGLPGIGGVGGVSPVYMSGMRGVTPVRPVGRFPRFNYVEAYHFRLGPLSYSQAFYGPAGFVVANRLNLPGIRLFNMGYAPTIYAPSTSSGYMTGAVRNPAVEAAGRNFAQAQLQAERRLRASTTTAPRSAIYDQWAYERMGVAGLPAMRTGAETPEQLDKALNAPSDQSVASGEALNHILTAAVAAQKKDTKVESAYLPPNLLSEVRFSGSNAADAVNLLRSAGHLEFPAAFNAGPLADLRPAVERDFAAATAPTLAGRPADAGKVAALEATAAKTRAALAPLVPDLGFEEAIAARKFLNQLDAVVAALKAPGATGLVDPRWAAEGTTVADLVRYMARNKLLFGPVTAGNTDAYSALHRGLAGYFFAVLDAQKPPPKK